MVLSHAVQDYSRLVPMHSTRSDNARAFAKTRTTCTAKPDADVTARAHLLDIIWPHFLVTPVRTSLSVFIARDSAAAHTATLLRLVRSTLDLTVIQSFCASTRLKRQLVVKQ